MEAGYPLAALRLSYRHDTTRTCGASCFRWNVTTAASAPPHRFLPYTKGGLYSWEQTRHENFATCSV
jgi:hypothetical protein